MIDVHERIAWSQGHTPQVEHPDALNRALVAPQRAGADAVGDRRLARKAAALFLAVSQRAPFHRSNARTAFAGMLVFLHRNGTQIEISFDALQSRLAGAGPQSMDEETLAAMMAPDLSRRSPTRASRRLLAALSHLARTIEAFDGDPALEEQVAALDIVGTGLSRALAPVIEGKVDNHKILADAYPAVDARWGEALSSSR